MSLLMFDTVPRPHVGEATFEYLNFDLGPRRVGSTFRFQHPTLSPNSSLFPYSCLLYPYETCLLPLYLT